MSEWLGNANDRSKLKPQERDERFVDPFTGCFGVEDMAGSWEK